jgi:hypothetical protein
MNVADKLGLGPKREHTKLDDDIYHVRVTPPAWSGFSGSYILLSADQFRRYSEDYLKGGKMIQEALPDLNDDQREILRSGIAPWEWDEKIKEEDE